MGVARSKRRHSSPPAPRRASRSLNSKSLKFTIDSDFKQTHTVLEQVLSDCKHHGYDTNSVFAIKLALDEALINAIKHGNKLDPAKKVQIEAKIDPNKVEITVEDQGPGFHRNGVPDPTVPENICKSTGRGILLMEAYMNEVKWTKNGRRVRMIKLKQPSS
jgi:serine/threonine-protein kinase RsbW